MTQEVTLATDDHTETVIVKKATLTDDHVRLEGFDPSFCPSGMEDGIEFFSKNLTAFIPSDSTVSVEAVQPIDQPVPEPDVFF